MSTSTQTLADVKAEAVRLTRERLAEELAKQGREIHRREAVAPKQVETLRTETAKGAPTPKVKET